LFFLSKRRLRLVLQKKILWEKGKYFLHLFSFIDSNEAHWCAHSTASPYFKPLAELPDHAQQCMKDVQLFGPVFADTSGRRAARQPQGKGEEEEREKEQESKEAG
jgi:hypothetical protein